MALFDLVAQLSRSYQEGGREAVLLDDATRAYRDHVDAEQLAHSLHCVSRETGAVEHCSCSRSASVQKARAEYERVRAELAQLTTEQHRATFFTGPRLIAELMR